jgi:Na+/H+ antiporter NhaA
MSLYLGDLAFGPDSALAQAQVRLGVIAGSLASVAVGALLLGWAGARRAAAGDDGPEGA